MRLEDGRKTNLFAAALSLIVPGAGEFYLGVPGRALFLLLLRIAVLLFIPMFVFDSHVEP